MSSIQTAVGQLHSLRLRLIAARKQSHRVNPEYRHSKAAWRAFVLKLQRVACLVTPDECGHCLAILDDHLDAYLEGAFGVYGYEKGPDGGYQQKAGAR